MATRQSTVDFILEQIEAAGNVYAKKMFGDYGIFCDDKTVALVCDGQLYVKPTEAGRKFLGDVEEGFPFPGSKPWFLISGEKWDDRAWLTSLIQISAANIPVTKKKARPAKKSSQG
jgi:TfoX/Sxy family transcriptional regulator of competence genes